MESSGGFALWSRAGVLEGSLWEAIGEMQLSCSGIHQLLWRCSFHGMTMKNSSNGGAGWSLEDKLCVLPRVELDKWAKPFGPLVESRSCVDPTHWTLGYWHHWSFVSLCSDCDYVCFFFLKQECITLNFFFLFYRSPQLSNGWFKKKRLWIWKETKIF